MKYEVRTIKDNKVTSIRKATNKATMEAVVQKIKDNINEIDCPMTIKIYSDGKEGQILIKSIQVTRCA